MEVSFSDGTAIIVGSASQAQVRSDSGTLTDLELLSGTFEVVTAPDGFLSLRVSDCVADIVNGTLRVRVAPERVDFILQSGNAALIRKGGQISHITKPGFGATTACNDDSAISTPAQPGEDALALLQDDLGQTDSLSLVSLSGPTEQSRPNDTTGINNVSYTSLNPTLILKPSVSPTGIDTTPTVFRLPVSVAPNTGDDLGGTVEPWSYPFGGGTEYFKNPTGTNETGGPGRTSPVPVDPDPTDLSVFTPSLAATSFGPSTIYQGGAKDLTDDIYFTVDPAARTAQVLPVRPPERITIAAGTTVDSQQASNGVLIRLPVANPADSYVTFTYRHVRYALLAGTHSTSGDLITSAVDASFPLGAYETFRLTPGTAQTMSGQVNGLAIDRNAGRYVTLASTGLQITPSNTPSLSSSLGPFGIGISATLDLNAGGTALSRIDLFGSAQNDSSHYFDLAAQNGGGVSVSLGSGERIPGLNVPASTQKYGSYLDWGILRGSIQTASQSVDLLPTPWVAGRAWSARDLDGFNGTANYSGHVLGNAVDGNGARTSFGSYANSWDFSTGTGTVQVDFDGASYSGQTARVAGTVGFTGDLSGAGRSGDLSGTFYGNSRVGVAPDAVGGAFSIRGAGADQYGAEGIFAGQKQ